MIKNVFATCLAVVFVFILTGNFFVTATLGFGLVFLGAVLGEGFFEEAVFFATAVVFLVSLVFFAIVLLRK